jgi:dihydroneopterin aldolase / 2-amino-4-hydroxy-6-hydroxymethyldihydropteridine diphosphokinase
VTDASPDAPILIGATSGELATLASQPWDVAHRTALAWVLDPTRTRTLLVEHRVHGWSCAGGHLESGETTAEGARRELREETGVDAPPSPAPVAVVAGSSCGRHPSAVHVGVGHLFVVDPEIVLRSEPGQRAAWFDLSRLPTPRAPDVDEVLSRLVGREAHRYRDAVTGRGRRLDRIDVHGLEVLTLIGALPHERQRNQPIRIDLTVEADLADAGRSDELADTVHYGDVTRTAASIARESTDVLLERLAQRIAEAILDKPRVEAVHVTVTKLRPPIDEHVDTTSVRIVRRRPRPTSAGTHRALVALGSNVGDREAHLRDALDRLARLGRLGAESQVYETSPVGGPDGQGAYLNMVAEVHTDLDPYALLRRCRQIEAAAGRVRIAHWGPRTLDVDILFYDEVTIADPMLTIPHPRFAERRFVLAPLSEVAPERCPAGWQERLPAGGETPAGPLTR